jgi:hypothetical protein
MNSAKRITALSLIPILLFALTACPAASKVNMYVDLAVGAVTNGLTLANTFGANIPQATIDEATNDGALLEKAVADWSAASATQKPGLWPEVQKDLDLFKNNLPALLNAVHVSNPLYAGIAQLAIVAVEDAVTFIEAQNPAVAGAKKAVPSKFSKKDYNAQIVAAGHPELQLK